MVRLIHQKFRLAMAHRGGNIAIVTGLCALPLFGLTGLAIDYAVELSAKTQLDQAADAAAVAAITTAKSVIGGGGTFTSAQVQGQAQGQKAFAATAGSPRFIPGGIPVPSVAIQQTSNGQGLTATIGYSTQTTSQFGRIFNVSSNNIRGTASSAAIINPYYQFIFVVDISGSMAIGGTSADIAGMIADPKIQCGFACHDPLNYRGPNYRLIAKNDGWTLKIDYVNTAIQNFITDLQKQTTGIAGVYSIGIDEFGTNFNVLLAPTTSFTTALNVASGIDVENIQPMSITQGYTQITSSLQAVSSQLTNVGDGSAVNKQQTYVIFLSDGVEDIPGYMMYGRGTDVSYTSACSTLKSQAGLTMITVGTPYPTIPGDSQYATLVAPWETSNVPNATASMQSCASGSNWSFQATDGPQINTAVQQALSQILQGMTRLTQ